VLRGVGTGKQGSVVDETVFQSSDLAKRRVELLDAARSGLARVRDKDGTSLVMIPESRLALLEELATWNNAHLQLERLLSRGCLPSVGDLGALAWLRVFDLGDLREFVAELHECLVAAHADQDVQPLAECLKAWRITARQLEDPLRRHVLTATDIRPTDLIEVDRPSEEAGRPSE
jgi:hypothetical protein